MKTYSIEEFQERMEKAQEAKAPSRKGHRVAAPPQGEGHAAVGEKSNPKKGKGKG